jgi:hypothetical protein
LGANVHKHASPLAMVLSSAIRRRVRVMPLVLGLLGVLTMAIAIPASAASSRACSEEFTSELVQAGGEGPPDLKQREWETPIDRTERPQ